MPSKVLAELPTPADRPRFNPQPKTGLPRPLAKKAKQEAAESKGKLFRDAIWTRDERRCRATGKLLLRSGTTDWERLGEVDHTLLRSTNPDRVYDTSNGLLLQKQLNRLRKVACLRAPEFKRFDYTGPHDRAKPQTFVWRDDDGQITRKRVG